MSQVRTPLILGEPLTGGYPNVRVTITFAEPLTGGYPNVRAPLILGEPLTGGYPTVRVPLFFVDALFPVEPEPVMTTDTFPGFGNSQSDPTLPAALDPFNSPLPGLGFSVHKKPSFKTKIHESSSSREVRTSFTPFPRWDFELTYEFLEDRSGADSSLKTILGFFTQMQGSFSQWLFKDPDDYLVVNGPIGTSDNTILQFYFLRYVNTGGLGERIGQVDDSNDINLYLSVAENDNIPGSGPYTITVTHSAAFVEDLGVTKGGTPMVKVASAPAAGQYSVAAGVYTFNAADHGAAVVISYRYLIDPADYTVTMPNYVVFDSAPPVGELSADFQFFYVCRFLEDEADFEKFYDKLWNLQTCSFKSILQ